MIFCIIGSSAPPVQFLIEDGVENGCKVLDVYDFRFLSFSPLGAVFVCSRLLIIG